MATNYDDLAKEQFGKRVSELDTKEAIAFVVGNASDDNELELYNALNEKARTGLTLLSLHNVSVRLSTHAERLHHMVHEAINSLSPGLLESEHVIHSSQSLN